MNSLTSKRPILAAFLIKFFPAVFVYGLRDKVESLKLAQK
jgi:hypothetical protein